MPQKSREPLSNDSTDESPDEVLDPYTYQELQSPSSVRLLRLRPGGKKATEVECELFEENLDRHPPYEALSWSWGGDSWDQNIRIHHGGTVYSFDVPRTLVAALKALRFKKKNRHLWIDAICINQVNPDEKNRQVPMMARIYGQATSVCVWIGEGNRNSKVALDFIKHEVLKLQNFDELCEDHDSSQKWLAMLNVMKRPWFSRRWVVQEIALANEATIYCGQETIEWKDFADAVQLFVEVETATHRLSEVMKTDPKFYHVPGWFEYVSALGASLLVDATGTLFRRAKNNHREPLLSLEYLVSSMTVFEATVPHDIIYSLLSIAKDTAPSPVIRSAQASKGSAKERLDAWAIRHMKAKPYKVDYKAPLVDICKDFIVFCLRQSDPTRALDIVCRPWAPTLNTKKKGDAAGRRSQKEPRHIPIQEQFSKMPSWIPTLSGAAHSMFEHANREHKMGRCNADALVGLPEYTQRNYSAAGTTQINDLSIRFKKHKEYYSMAVPGFVCDEISVVEKSSQGGNIPEEWIALGGWEDFDQPPPQELWRTHVADRGKNGRNPPTYYSRAFEESINKGLESGSLNTTELINDGRCSVIAEYFRRVQAVIWNRSLMQTKAKALGIVSKHAKPDDLICILPGCSVPVVLRRHEKTEKEIQDEEKEYQEDKLEAAIKVQRIYRVQRDLKEKRDAAAAAKQAKEDAKLEETRPSKRARTEPLHNHMAPTDAIDTEPLAAFTSPKRTGTGLSTASDVHSTSSTAYSTRSARAYPHARFPSISPEVRAAQDEKAERKREQRRYWYRFIGECYVHGIMDGEAIKKQNVEQIPSQVFELR